MKTPTTYRELFDSVRNTLPYKVEGVIIEFTEQVADRLGALGLSRTALSERLNTSPAYVTKLLSGGTNFTLESMVKIADALESDIDIQWVPRASQCDWIRVIGGCAAFSGLHDHGLKAEWRRRTTAADEAEAPIGSRRWDWDAYAELDCSFR